MIFRKIKRKLPLIAFTVLLLQAIGLFYCGDKDCLLGESDEICRTSICCLFDNHDHSQEPSELNQDDSCQSTCCLSYIIPEFNSFSITFLVSCFYIEPRSFISTLVRRIDHIPRAWAQVSSLYYCAPRFALSIDASELCFVNCFFSSLADPGDIIAVSEVEPSEPFRLDLSRRVVLRQIRLIRTLAVLIIFLILPEASMVQEETLLMLQSVLLLRNKTIQSWWLSVVIMPPPKASFGRTGGL